MSTAIPRLRTQARAKINLCLLLGPMREDGYHEVMTVILPVELADSVSIGPGEGQADEVVCPGVEGENLAALAIRLFRERSGWDGPPVRIEIEKRVPVAAGMGGGSGDAAAALRLIGEVAGGAHSDLAERIAPLLGADVPAMLDGRPVLAMGIGERLEPLPEPSACGLLILPAKVGLSTPTVFKRAAELGLRRGQAELDTAAAEVRSAAGIRRLDATGRPGRPQRPRRRRSRPLGRGGRFAADCPRCRSRHGVRDRLRTNRGRPVRGG